MVPPPHLPLPSLLVVPMQGQKTKDRFKKTKRVCSYEIDRYAHMPLPFRSNCIAFRSVWSFSVCIAYCSVDVINMERTGMCVYIRIFEYVLLYRVCDSD